ncbi:MAG TPA: hypothetical protein VF604_09560 [Pyrinomonadaceae bacterium]|jgi:hypothetical protein
MAFGISFADIELLIRLSQNQTAENEPVVISPDAVLLPEVIIPVLSETSFGSDFFSAKNSEMDIEAVLTGNIPPVLTAPPEASAGKPAKSLLEENNKVAGTVFDLISQPNPPGIKQSTVNAAAATNNFSGTQSLKQNQSDAEIIFRNLLEKFRAALVYDYEVSDAVKLEEDAARKHKPFENFSRRFAGSNEDRAETNRKKAIRDKENLKHETLRKTDVDVENQSREEKMRESKKRELLKKIREANKFL